MLPGELSVALRVGRYKEVSKSESQDVYFDQTHGTARLVGVADGHGPHGLQVSTFIAQKLPIQLFQRHIKKDIDSFAQALALSFMDCNSLLKESGIEVEHSGSTCLSLLVAPGFVICANVGDSRALIGRCMRGAWSVHQLSWDHKPDNPQEYQRITRAGGSVSPIKGTYRVYANGGKYPGLSISRVIGHKKAAEVGVVCEPEVQAVSLTAVDKFLILATDGLWQVMTSIEAVKLAASVYRKDAAGVAEALAQEAESRWTRRGSYMDDITVLFLPILPST